MGDPQIASEIKIDPLRPQDLEFGIHAYQQFSCRVKDDITPEDLLDKNFWSFVIPKIKLGAEIRVIPNNFAWRAQLLVTFTDGTNVRLKMISLVELDDVRPTLMKAVANEFDLVMRGQQKWCVQRKADGEFIKELIPTKQEAVVWLDKYMLALDGDKDAEDYLTNLDY